MQYLNLLGWLGWQHSRLARVVLGSRFAWGDMQAYSLGALLVLAVEWLHRQASRRDLTRATAGHSSVTMTINEASISRQSSSC